MKTRKVRPRAEATERLTWTEICKRFPDEWVVLVEATRGKRHIECGSALVFGHHKHRKDASQDVKAAFERYDVVASYWTGEIRGPWSAVAAS